MDTKNLEAADNQKQINRESEIPIEGDFHILCAGILKEMVARKKSLDETRNKKNWRLLAEALEVYLVVFNGKRGSEVSQLLLEEYIRYGSFRFFPNQTGNVSLNLQNDYDKLP